MKIIPTIGILLATAAATLAGDWQTLFDGSSLDGWKASEKEGCFSIVDGDTLKVEGGRSHLFWMGTDSIPGTFTDFEFSAKVKTTKGSNGGIFFHTVYQETGWPKQGYEAQVNTTHKDQRKTASIYAVKDVMNDAPSKDNEWFNYLIRVKGKTITILIDGKVVNEYTEPADLQLPEKFKDRKLSSGTFALQGHDPKSITYYQDIKVRELK
ncbi:3-keto-disaccharide hydrolase [Pontiella sulfatireligans]|uniref:3-keto-alpha-glucoside-1,2-lyase/3-keto-2-hydroxy-glucal hydratase domain-containing protein n=1 Tax=Pontiella sulfatireligans TaxID=2750658 RepID=A0A6C2UXH9_9BACT|nr:DUF1080 domain-containing protein [Pontiella sulfatireligans]VGO23566.1 hypothetical protein SCARR_05673 [Pontiella sulfatireligans]